MPTYTGTTGNDSWNLITPGTFTLDGLAGVDTLNLGTSLRSSYNITQASDGAVHIDSISGASAALHATLYNMEVLTFNSGRDVLDLRTYFGSKVPPTVSITDNTAGTAIGNVSYLLNFSETITGLAANDFTVSNGSVVSVSGSGSSYSIVVAPAANAEGTMSLTLNAASVTDTWGNTNAATTAAAQPIDTRLPTVSSVNPANQGTNVAVGSDIVFNFSEPIAKGTGNITLMTAAGATVASYDAANSPNLSISGNTLTINPTADLGYGTSYKVEFAGGTIKDLAGNSYAGAASYTFTTAAFVNSPPTGTITIAGNPSVGQLLTASNTLADPDGLGAISYQWSAGGVAISGATSSTFTPTQAQVGLTVSVAASYTDGHGTLESVNSGATGSVAAVALPGPVVSTFAPADEAKGVQVGANITFTFNEPIQWGNGSITLKDATGATVATYNASASSYLSLSGNTITLNPSKDLGIFAGYKVEIGAGAVKDLAGNGNLAVTDYNFTTQTVDGLYHFFVVAFDAAPGVEYMNQLAEAWNYGYDLQKIVNVFTTKHQFTDVYSLSLSHLDMATSLVDNIVKNSATADAKLQAVADIKGALDIGWTVGDMIYTVFGNLANKPLNDATWGGTAQQFLNETAVARYYTEVMGAGGTDLPTLRAVIGSVDNHTDVSTPDVIATLIGVELSHLV